MDLETTRQLGESLVIRAEHGEVLTIITIDEVVNNRVRLTISSPLRFTVSRAEMTDKGNVDAEDHTDQDPDLQVF
jgi:sRNA-binding carbon storage regulator CsrA